ncbi:tetratricopeptide repeat protein [Winogradskyella sediminis]|uniref:tetratricopeptide repeat protein n=1 Tax=Winogradskyella sediminis TaxID=1382466 RepID=UPI003AA9277B
MKKQIIIIVVLLVTGLTQAQSNFEKGMSKAFELWQADKTDEAENMFERIAKAEPKEWLPNYYIAQINSLKSWTEKDATVLKAQLDKAQQHLDEAMLKSENNAEILVMQAQVLTNWVAFDGMTYGMKYGAKISELYNKALAIDATNPRAALGKAEWAMGSAKYFGKDTAPYCKEVEASIELFNTFKPESRLHPNWGKERAVAVAKNCKA